MSRIKCFQNSILHMHAKFNTDRTNNKNFFRECYCPHNSGRINSGMPQVSAMAVNYQTVMLQLSRILLMLLWSTLLRVTQSGCETSMTHKKRFFKGGCTRSSKLDKYAWSSDLFQANLIVGMARLDQVLDLTNRLRLDSIWFMSLSEALTWQAKARV